MLKRRTKKSVKKRKASCKYRLEKHDKYLLTSYLAITIRNKFPALYTKLEQLPDFRKRYYYSVKELIVSGLLLFLFKQRSRNNADNKSKNLDYQDNILRFFKVKVADLDTVDRYLRQLDASYLQEIKTYLIKSLIRSKMFDKHKLFGQYHMIAVDGSGFQSFNYEPYNGCPFREFKNGNKSWTVQILEAKLVTFDGFSLSLCTQWIENPIDEEFEKQDSELKAYKILVEKIKEMYPRLQIVFLLDGLYPNEPVFKSLSGLDYKFLITLREKQLPTVNKQVNDILDFQEEFNVKRVFVGSTIKYIDDYKILKKIEYRKKDYHVLQDDYKEINIKDKKILKRIKFRYITNIKLTTKNIDDVGTTARLRWKIENEGFNNQKNNDYYASHKFSRTNANATKNYYLLLQIADIINQLVYKSKFMAARNEEQGSSKKSLLEIIFSHLVAYIFDDLELINSILSTKVQLRY